MVSELPEVRAFTFGIVLAAAVGPIALLIAANSLRFGLASGVQSAIGAALGDLTYALLAVAAGASVTGLLLAHTRQIHVFGSVVLTLYGAYLVTSVGRGSNAVQVMEPYQTSTRFRQLHATYGLTMINPLTVVVFGGFIAQLPVGLPVARLVSVALSLFMGSLAIQLGIAIAASLIGSRLQDGNWTRKLNAASGCAVIIFGILGLI